MCMSNDNAQILLTVSSKRLKLTIARNQSHLLFLLFKMQEVKVKLNRRITS